MKKLRLDARAVADIDKIIARVHRDIGNPTGKVDLSAVRHVLKLDLAYYQSSDESLLNEVMHKLHVGAKQVLERPTLLIDAIRKFDLRALILPDKKKILLDKDQPPLKLRWYEAHEISHGVTPWHGAYTLGDNGNTVSPQCQETVEAEANWGAGRLLFPPKIFSQMVLDSRPSFELIESIEKQFGNTKTTTLWRVVEQSEGPTFGVIGAHPHHANEGEAVIAHLIQSDSFAVQFPDLSEQEIATALRSICTYKKKGPIGEGMVQLSDANGNLRTFALKIFCNTYQCLTIGYEGTVSIL